jgi:hypothetical protein
VENSTDAKAPANYCMSPFQYDLDFAPAPLNRISAVVELNQVMLSASNGEAHRKGGSDVHL